MRHGFVCRFGACDIPLVPTLFDFKLYAQLRLIGSFNKGFLELCSLKQMVHLKKLCAVFVWGGLYRLCACIVQKVCIFKFCHIKRKNSVIGPSVVTGSIAVDALSGLYRGLRHEGTTFPFAELRRALPIMRSCEIQRPDRRPDAIGVTGIVTVRIAVAVAIREIGCRDDVQRLPQRCLLFRTYGVLYRRFESFCIGFAQIFNECHQLINFKHNARVFVEICRNRFGHILQFIL
jgi:hypothetical protein